MARLATQYGIDEEEHEDMRLVLGDDIAGYEYMDTVTASWSTNPNMQLRWAILETWIWDYLKGDAKLDDNLPFFRELVSQFPELPSDLAERLMRMSDEDKLAAITPRVGLRRRTVLRGARYSGQTELLAGGSRPGGINEQSRRRKSTYRQRIKP